MCTRGLLGRALGRPGVFKESWGSFSASREEASGYGGFSFDEPLALTLLQDFGS